MSEVEYSKEFLEFVGTLSDEQIEAAKKNVIMSRHEPEWMQELLRKACSEDIGLVVYCLDGDIWQLCYYSQDEHTYRLHNDFKRPEVDRFTFYHEHITSKSYWSLMAHPKNVVMASSDLHHIGDIGLSFDERTRNGIKEISAKEAKYVQSNPEGDGWELRIARTGDQYLDQFGVTHLAEEGVYWPCNSFLFGLRWCLKLQEEKKPQEERPDHLCTMKKFRDEVAQALADMDSRIEELEAAR